MKIKDSANQPIAFNMDQFIGRRVAVFGDFMVDEYLQGAVSRISPEAPVPIVHVQSRSKRMGGAGNVVLNLQALGARVSAIGVLGQDSEGDWLIRQFGDRGVDVAGLMQSAAVTTSIKTRITAQNQQLLRYDQEVVRDADDAFITFLQSNLERLLHGACAVIVSDYRKGAVTRQTVQLIIAAAKKEAIPVIIDPKGNDYTIYHGATACTPNMKELKAAVGRELAGEEEIRKAGVELCSACGIEYILATRSEDGMSLIHGATGEKEDFPAIAKEIVDVTGAGDTVISVFALCFALGASHSDCCRIANLAASIVISKFGTAVATADEIRMLQSKGEEDGAKALTTAEAARKAELLRRQGKRIVFTNGCFDLVHAGHIASFKQAKEHGDILFLGLNSDASIRRIKGENRPIVTQENRRALLEAISWVDYIVLFDEDTPESLIRAIKPDVLIKGKDWEGKTVAGGEFVLENGGEVCFINLEQGLSTTNIIDKILSVYGGSKK